jgi:predicted dienelactone hydrolase
VGRLLLAASLLFILLVSVAWGQEAAFRAGVTRLPIETDPPFDTLVWYPTPDEEAPWQVGQIRVPASYDAKWAAGPFPVVLLAHGGGPTGGSPLILSELSADLARHGFVVVAPFQGRAGLAPRTVQMKQAFDAVRADPRLAPHLDPARLGLLGFSLGGAVALELAGASPDRAHFAAYCGTHADDAMSCGHRPGGDRTDLPGLAPARLPVTAAVLLDPLAALFSTDGLAALRLPITIFRPDRSALSGEGSALALAAALPHSAKLVAIPGSHFIFTDLCAPALAADAPELCRDPPGVDRGAVHADIETQIVRFLRERL